jgi:hypothetical protein
MKRIIASFFPILLFLFASSAAAEEPAVSARDLIDHAKEYDGKAVVFTGEAIGDSMRRGDHAWVNVLDSDAAMGVYLPASALGAIRHYGSNSMKGDTVRVRGVFSRACPEHGGDMDIHASAVEIVARGASTPRPVDSLKLALTPAFLGLSALLYLLWRRRERSIRPEAGRRGDSRRRSR